jgi:hypothetical protein
MAAKVSYTAIKNAICGRKKDLLGISQSFASQVVESQVKRERRQLKVGELD